MAKQRGAPVEKLEGVKMNFEAYFFMLWKVKKMHDHISMHGLENKIQPFRL